MGTVVFPEVTHGTVVGTCTLAFTVNVVRSTLLAAADIPNILVAIRGVRELIRKESSSATFQKNFYDFFRFE
jgi:hypothetical protein